MNYNREELAALISRAITEQLGLDEGLEIGDTDIVEGLGADSLDIIELAVRLEKKFGISVPDEDIAGIRTANEAADYIAARFGSSEG